MIVNICVYIQDFVTVEIIEQKSQLAQRVYPLPQGKWNQMHYSLCVSQYLLW